LGLPKSEGWKSKSEGWKSGLKTFFP